MGRYQYSRPPQSWNRHRQQRALRGRSGLEPAPLRQGSQHRQAGIAPEPGSRMDQSAGPASADRGRCALERGARMPKADRGNLRPESGQHAWEGRARRLHLANRPVSLLSGLMTCGCCGGKVGIILSNRLGRLNPHRRGPCTNNRVPISFSRPCGDPDGLLDLRKPGIRLANVVLSGDIKGQLDVVAMVGIETLDVDVDLITPIAVETANLIDVGVAIETWKACSAVPLKAV
ncbi:hypothetical protein SAMN04244548_01756 [Paracoccus pantotrophus]|nr:hypothetical protein SAMN04244548_01756 [Paracoccus pantotrophus]